MFPSRRSSVRGGKSLHMKVNLAYWHQLPPAARRIPYLREAALRSTGAAQIKAKAKVDGVASCEWTDGEPYLQGWLPSSSAKAVGKSMHAHLCLSRHGPMMHPAPSGCVRWLGRVEVNKSTGTGWEVIGCGSCPARTHAAIAR